MENVLTVKRDLLAGLLPPCGISTENTDKIVDIILKAHEFLPRPEAENDPSHKQIISYVTLCRQNEVFVTRRLKKGGEARLHGLLSLGIGGHINPETDGDGCDILSRGLKRELDEEVAVERLGALVPRGVINDDATEVGRVHLGLFFTAEVEGGVSVRETEKLEGFWVKRDALPALASQMETWSQLVLSALC
ncbi:MAG: NUDIX domain-containing protein [Oscillospiraceae bacterium]|jgi:predicted NUDIX family phosphoesterase|nr:NUDIX domain-containing protein [Oscillospiraceae bacterium]